MENHTVIKAAIRTVVSRGIRDIRRDPHRSIRKLVDLGMQFGKGRNQQSFFTDAHSILKDSASPYYQLVTTLTHTVDSQTLETLGLNVGYMSWTLGATMIRAQERDHGYHVPWTVLVQTGSPAGRRLDLCRLAAEGQALGIYTYFLFINRETGSLTPLLTAAEQCPSSAFFLFAQDEVANAQLAALEPPYRNTLLVPRGLIHGVEAVSYALAQKKRMFGLNCEYNASKADDLLSDRFLQNVAAQGYPFLFLIPAADCDAQTRARVNAGVVALRAALRYPFFPIDLCHDVREVDRIISDEGCLFALGADGTVLHPGGGDALCFDPLPLTELLRQTMPAIRRCR